MGWVEGRETIFTWTSDGRYLAGDGDEYGLDLIPYQESPTAVYRNPDTGALSTEPQEGFTQTYTLAPQ